MDQDPRLELEDTKAADLPTVKEMRDLSVQDRADKTPTTWGLDLSILLTWPTTDPEGMPPWPSSARDTRLREFWPQIPLLAAVITAFVSRIKTLPFRIEADDEKDATYWNWVLSNGDFGKGWGYTVGKFVLDILTQDNGGFIEVLRPARARGAKGLLPLYRLGPDAYAIKSGDDYVRLGRRALKAVTDDPWETPIGIAHLDAGKCVRLRDPEIPIQYRSQKGARPLKSHQVFDASWMTSAEENRAGYGMCPVTLALVVSRITKNIDTYIDEKVGGRYFKRIIYGTNIFQGRLEQAIKEAEAQADARGLTRYATNIVVGSADLTSPGEVGVLDLTGLPDGFDRETEYDIAADLVTACFGLDRPEVIPMRTATLGQAGQVGVMAMKARGKGVAEVIRLVERFVSNWLLPSDGSVAFAFDYKDDEEDARRAEIKNKEADTLVKLAAAPTAEGVPVFTRSEFRSLCERYELIPEKLLTEEEKEETPAVEQEQEEKAIGLKARHSRSRCMNCNSPPEVDVQWADGRARAWFCLPCFEKWAHEEPREIVRAWYVEGGEVPKHVDEYNRSVQVRTLGSGVGPKEIADRVRELAEDAKAGPGRGWWGPPRGSHGEGAEAGGLSEGATKAISQYATSIMAFGQHTGKEAGTAIDKDGNPLGEKLVVGSHDSLDVSGVITSDEYVIIHNHPSSTSFSPHDCALLWTTNAEHLVVIGHDGTLYRMSKTPKTSKLSAAEGDIEAIKSILVSDWKGKNKLLTPEFTKRVESGAMGADEAWKEQTHQVMKDFASSLGLHYERVQP